jgi:hypothetical protein
MTQKERTRYKKTREDISFIFHCDTWNETEMSLTLVLRKQRQHNSSQEFGR